MRLSYCVGLFLLGAACGGDQQLSAANCGDISVPAITLTTLNGLTSQPIVEHAVVVARDGAYADTAKGIPPTYPMAYDRPGIYTVTVAAAGYQSWRIDSVDVQKEACGVRSLPLAARLTPATSGH